MNKPLARKTVKELVDIFYERGQDERRAAAATIVEAIAPDILDRSNKYQELLSKGGSGLGLDELSNREIIKRALIMWKCHIESGNVTLTAVDCHNCGHPEWAKPLDSNQKRFIIRLEDLVKLLQT